ncbi:MAG TPA: hypothetical protein V6D08_01735 [Candidatus Obscuribacterales bacterium]
MTDAKPDKSIEGAGEAEAKERPAQGADARTPDDQAGDVRKRIKALREEVFEELEHLPGYSDMHGGAKLALIYFEEEDSADEGADDTATADKDAVERSSQTLENKVTDSSAAVDQRRQNV